MLEFDAYQRSETVRRILKAVMSSGALALDVGGYPGRLRTLMPEYRWVICDPLVDAPGDQVVGDASALPFGNLSVDVSVSLDVLEHIPAINRKAFLHEICRVSKQGFILSFPHDDALVQQAETSIRKAYQEKYAGKKHPWLEEHHIYGLPNVDEIKTVCANMGLYVQALPVGNIERWHMLQWFGVMMEDHAEGIEAAKKVDEFYQDHVYPYDFHSSSYRIVLLCWKEEPPIHLNTIFPETQNHHQNVDIELQALFFQQCVKPVSSNNSTKEMMDGLNDLTSNNVKNYISRLETGLQLWEDTCAMLNKRILEELQWRDKVESHPAMRWYKRVKRLFRI